MAPKRRRILRKSSESTLQVRWQELDSVDAPPIGEHVPEFVPQPVANGEAPMQDLESEEWSTGFGCEDMDLLCVPDLALAAAFVWGDGAPSHTGQQLFNDDEDALAQWGSALG